MPSPTSWPGSTTASAPRRAEPALLQNPQVMALSSALCSAVATIFIQRGLHRSNFYAGFWINIAVGVIGLWSLVLLLVPFADYNWHAVPYFVFSGVVGTAGGRLFRVLAIHQVGASVASAITITAALIASSAFVVATGNHGSLRCDRRSLRYFIAGGIAENAGVFLVLASLGFGDVSIVTPLAGTSPLFVLLLAYFFPSRAEKLTWRVVVGAVLIVLGVVMLSR